MSVSFDGITKRIAVNPGVTQINVASDLYSAWKEWVSTSDNAKYPMAFRTFGGDSTIESQYAPSYFFLTNGWRIVVDGQEVVFGVNLYTDEGESAIVTVNGGTASVRNSDAPIVKNEIENALDYAGCVVIDPSSPHSGVTYPAGTQAAPVNNPTDALTIAREYGINKYLVRGTITIIDDMSGSKFVGDSYGSRVTVESFASVHSSQFRDIVIDGDFSGGDLQAKNCTIGDSVNMSGELISCGLKDNIHIKPYGELTLDRCSSRIPGNASVVLNMNPTNDVRLNVRAYSGGLHIVHCDTPDSIGTIEVVSGKVTIDATCTDGVLSVRGVAKVINNASGTLMDTSALVGELVEVDASGATLSVDETAIANAVWGRAERSLTTDVGLTSEDLQKIDDIKTSVDEILDVQKGNWEIVGTQMIFYRRDGSELMRFDLLDSKGSPTTHKVYRREKV